MLKKLMITTALSGVMIGAAFAQSAPSSAPADRPATPPAATQSSPPDSSAGTQSSPSSPPAATQSSPASPPASSMPAPDTRAAAPTATPAASAQVINSQKPDQFLASKFKGTDVIGADNQKIGDVSDMLFDKSGKIDAFIISVGGFLGMGSKEVALAPNTFEVVPGDKSKNEADKLKLSMTKDQLKQAANFEPYTAPRTTTGMGGPTGGSPRPAPASPQR